MMVEQPCVCADDNTTATIYMCSYNNNPCDMTIDTTMDLAAESEVKLKGAI